MKNNFVSKHMNTFNRASVHSDAKKDFILNDDEHINEGIQELIDEETEDSYENEDNN